MPSSSHWRRPRRAWAEQRHAAATLNFAEPVRVAVGSARLSWMIMSRWWRGFDGERGEKVVDV
jgi:hypothetical protein